MPSTPQNNLSYKPPPPIEIQCIRVRNLINSPRICQIAVPSRISKQMLARDPASVKGLRYQAVAAQLLAVSQNVPVGNSVLIEYDSVMNQLLIYMHMWQIPQVNPFYARLLVIANEAYQDRQ